MVCSRLKMRVALRRKLHILRTISHSKSVKKNCDAMDALLCIYFLKLKLDSIKRELSCLMPKKEVKVERAGKGFMVRVVCEKKGENYLVRILEVFEEMGIIVLHAKVSCNPYFSMEAIVATDNEEHDSGDDPEVKEITRALLRAIDGESGETGISEK